MCKIFSTPTEAIAQIPRVTPIGQSSGTAGYLWPYLKNPTSPTCITAIDATQILFCSMSCIFVVDSYDGIVLYVDIRLYGESSHATTIVVGDGYTHSRPLQL